MYMSVTEWAVDGNDGAGKSNDFALNKKQKCKNENKCFHHL